MVHVNIEIDQPAEEGVDVAIECAFDVTPLGCWMDVVWDNVTSGVHEGIADWGLPIPEIGLVICVKDVVVDPGMLDNASEVRARAISETIRALVRATVHSQLQRLWYPPSLESMAPTPAPASPDGCPRGR